MRSWQTRDSIHFHPLHRIESGHVHLLHRVEPGHVHPPRRPPGLL